MGSEVCIALNYCGTNLTNALFTVLLLIQKNKTRRRKYFDTTIAFY